MRSDCYLCDCFLFTIVNSWDDVCEFFKFLNHFLKRFNIVTQYECGCLKFVGYLHSYVSFSFTSSHYDKSATVFVLSFPEFNHVYNVFLFFGRCSGIFQSKRKPLSWGAIFPVVYVTSRRRECILSSIESILFFEFRKSIFFTRL